MRIPLIIILLLALSASAYSQEGYIRLNNDSVLTGFLRYYVSIKDGKPGYELWKTRRDRKPFKKIPKHTIKEYALKNDTFKIFRQFKPYPDKNTYYESIDAVLESRGEVSLYRIDLVTTQNPGAVNAQTTNNMIYVLENISTGTLQGIPRDKVRMKEMLLEFIPEEYLTEYIKNNWTGFTYEAIPKIVKSYRKQ